MNDKADYTSHDAHPSNRSGDRLLRQRLIAFLAAGASVLTLAAYNGSDSSPDAPSVITMEADAISTDINLSLGSP